MKISEKNKFLTIVVLFWFAQYVYIPYQTPYLTAISVNAGFIGIIIGAYGLSQMLLRIPLGVAADLKVNHRILVILGTFLAGLASLIRIIIPSGQGFLWANIVSGIASATWISFIVMFLKINSPKSKLQSMGTLVTFNNIGMLCGFLFASLFSSTVSMKGLCMVGMLCGFLGGIIAITLKKQSYQSRDNQSVMSLLSALKNKRLLLCAFLALIQQGIQMSTTMSFTTQVISSLHAPSYAEGLASIIYMLAAVVFASMTSGKLMQKISKKTILVISFFLLAVYCFLVPKMTSVYAIYLLQLIPGLGTGVLFATLNAESISEIPADKVSTATGFFQAVYALGMTTFPIIAGQIKGQYSIEAAFSVLAVCALVGGVVSLLYKERNN